MATSSREEIATDYLDRLPYPPYPLQEEAILAWFLAEQGVMVCAPTGTGKTLIALGALYEALRTGTQAYYTTPLIALTEQKFYEIQSAVVRWGYFPEQVGLVTGNRKINPDAPILIVVAEILLNRLLHPEGFTFDKVSAVVMDEFHSFADPERGIVWELALSMLPKSVRLLLLSATVGNSYEFIHWLDRCHGRKIELVEGKERKVSLNYIWVDNHFLGELLEELAAGDEKSRKTPALVFCFNRDECWSVAEMLKGLNLIRGPQKDELIKEINDLNWPNGVGPKLKQMLRRGVGVHHAGLLPIYRRKVEELFEKKLLSVAVCTETLAAGINLPARSVILTSLMKGPYGKEKLMDSSTAHQIFGRAGRPQYDTEGFVYAVAHEDDVRLLRWKQKYDQIPEDTKDPVLLKKKKELKRKKPDKSTVRQYWTSAHFDKLKAAPPGKLYSKGPFPWRLLAYLLKISPEVSRLRSVVRKRLLDEPRILSALKVLDAMLLTLHDAGYVRLEPLPVRDEKGYYAKDYQAEYAHATSTLDLLLAFRSVNPLYGAYLVQHLGVANREERIQAFESVLEIPRPLLKYVRPIGVPPGPLELNRIQLELEQRGLVAVRKKSAEEKRQDLLKSVNGIPGDSSLITNLEDFEEMEDLEEEEEIEEEKQPFFAEKLLMYFQIDHPGIDDLIINPVWVAGLLLNEFHGNFNLFMKQRDLIKQEGIFFRHLLRLILLLEEFMQLTPPDVSAEAWKDDLLQLARQLTESCSVIDSTNTSQVLKKAHAADVVEGETVVDELTEKILQVQDYSKNDTPEGFGEGILDSFSE